MGFLFKCMEICETLLISDWGLLPPEIGGWGDKKGQELEMYVDSAVSETVLPSKELSHPESQKLPKKC